MAAATPRGREFLPITRRSAIPHPRLIDLYFADAREQRSLFHVAIANDELPATLVATLGPLLEPFLDLCFDGLGEQLLGALTQDVGEDIFAPGQWHNPLFTRTNSLVAYSSASLANWEETVVQFLPKCAAFFIRLSTTFGYSSDLPTADQLVAAEIAKQSQRMQNI
jgi:hypothetical protein